MSCFSPVGGRERSLSGVDASPLKPRVHAGVVLSAFDVGQCQYPNEAGPVFTGIKVPTWSGSDFGVVMVVGPCQTGGGAPMLELRRRGAVRVRVRVRRRSPRASDRGERSVTMS
jgi:hypothetical protein